MSEVRLQAIEPSKLILKADHHELVMGIACPVGTGETNAALNVGGEAEVFRDAIASVLNFRTLRGLGSISINVNGDVVEISSIPLTLLVNPTPADDAYPVGQLWLNTANNTVWVLTDNTPAAAVWKQAAGDAWREDQFTATAGQVTFILSQAPTDPGSVELDVNGVTYEGGAVDYNISGVTITWLNGVFSMSAGDRVLVRYR